MDGQKREVASGTVSPEAYDRVKDGEMTRSP